LGGLPTERVGGELASGGARDVPAGGTTRGALAPFGRARLAARRLRPQGTAADRDLGAADAAAQDVGPRAPHPPLRARHSSVDAGDTALTNGRRPRSGAR